jgi:hypothetical protein
MPARMCRAKSRVFHFHSQVCSSPDNAREGPLQSARGCIEATAQYAYNCTSYLIELQILICRYGSMFCAFAENIWPKLQHEAKQPSFKPPRSNISNGDLRVDGFITSYSTSFNAPFDHMVKIRSPMRNPDLAQATDLRPLYLSSFNRVTE